MCELNLTFGCCCCVVDTLLVHYEHCSCVHVCMSVCELLASFHARQTITASPPATPTQLVIFY